MSVKIMSYVWDVPTFKGSDKLIMLCLADFANEEGFCWPSIETISRKSGVSASTVKSVLKKLVQAQWLTKKNQFKKVEGKSVRASNQYLLHVGKLRKHAFEASDYLLGTQSQQPDLEHSELEQTESEQADLERSEYTQGVGQISAGGRSESGYKPSIDPSIDPSSKDLAPSKLEASEPSVISLPTNRKGELYEVSASQVMDWKQTYPAVDVLEQLRKMKVWSDANPRKRKTLGGMVRFITAWLGREQDKGRYLPPEQTAKPVKTDGDSLKAKVRQLEMDIDGENQHLLRIMSFGGTTEAAINASKSKIKRLSDERRGLLDQLAEVDSDGGAVGWSDEFAA